MGIFSNIFFSRPPSLKTQIFSPGNINFLSLISSAEMYQFLHHVLEKGTKKTDRQTDIQTDRQTLKGVWFECKILVKYQGGEIDYREHLKTHY